MISSRSPIVLLRAVGAAGTSPRASRRWAGLATLALAGGAAVAASAPGVVARALPTPAAANSETPGLARGVDGGVWLSWVERVGDGRHALRAARLRGDAWRETRTIATGDSFMVSGADPASVQPLAGGAMAAQWRLRWPGEEAMQVRVVVAPSSGSTRSDASPHADRSATEHGFVSLAPMSSGAIVVWLDGRAFATAGEGHDSEAKQQPTPAHRDHAASDAGMQLRAATLAPDGAIGPERVIDERACECCGTALVATDRGLLLAYRDRGPDERRDIALSRYEDGRWTAPYDLHHDGWIVRGCPVNGPALDARGSLVAAAWYTGAEDSARVRVAFSTDGGGHFGDAIEVDAVAPLGRVGVAVLSDGSAAVSWVAPRDNVPWLETRRVRPDGRRGPVRAIASLMAVRGSGMPRVVRDNQRLVFAWTEAASTRHVKSATLPVSALD